MQLPWDEHFAEIVLPAWQAYRAAETRLSAATENETQVERAAYDALREGGAAAFYLHHFGEIVLRARPEWLPPELTRPHEVWAWLASFCTMLRTERPIDDVALLWAVADALKHGVLTRNPDQRPIEANEAVLVVSSGYGTLAFGEGKYGGGAQVVLQAKTGPRALSSVLQNVVDAWRRAAGLPLPPIGEGRSLALTPSTEF